MKTFDEEIARLKELPNKDPNQVYTTDYVIIENSLGYYIGKYNLHWLGDEWVALPDPNKVSKYYKFLDEAYDKLTKINETKGYSNVPA